jgi:hypothetical protein
MLFAKQIGTGLLIFAAKVQFRRFTTGGPKQVAPHAMPTQYALL